MKKLFIIPLLLFLNSIYIVAQRPQTQPTTDAEFRKARDLYEQKKYAEAYHLFAEEVEALDTDASMARDEAQAYLAFCAYELRRSDASSMITDYLRRCPYTPYISDLHFMAGILATEAGDFKNAIDHFSLIVPTELAEQHRADYLFYRAYADLSTGNLKQATEEFKQVIEQQNRYAVTAKYYYGYCLYAQKDYDGALPYFLEIETHSAFRSSVPYYIVQIYYARQDYEQAYTRAEQLLKEYPNNPANAELHRMLGELYYEQKNYKAAIEHLKPYADQQKKVQRNNLYILGLSYYQEKDYANAVKYLVQTTTEDDLMSENAYLHMGNAYVRLGQKDKARIAYSNAVKTNHDATVHEEAMYNYALTTYETQDAFGESVNAFVTFMTTYPHSKHINEAYKLFGEALLRTSNYAEAYKALQSVNQNNPQLARTRQYLLYQMGIIAHEDKEWSKAISYFSDAIATAPNGKYTTDCLFWRSECLYQTGQYAAAQADLEQYVQRPDYASNPNKDIAPYAAGYAYFAQKKYDEALRQFLSYTAKAQPNERHTDALNRIGDCYFHRRNFGQAEHYYAQVITSGKQGADYAYFQRGSVLGLLKRYKDKIAVLGKLTSLYPKSDYADDALYETGRAHLMLDENQAAIQAYERLLSSYPHSNLARLAALEIGMVYFNLQQYDQAIEAYKKVIANYPGSEESYTALQGIEGAYIETNRVNDYIAYTKTLGNVITVTSENKEDSLTYVAAELQYSNGNYTEAATGMESYIQQFCPVGRYCTLAWYYLADSRYRLNDKENALTAYDALTQITGNQYMEEAYTRCAELAYDLERFDTARTYFGHLQTVASRTEIINAARLGILRCNNHLHDYDSTIVAASRIISETTDEDIIREARYTRAKAQLAKEQYALSMNDLSILSHNLKNIMGAEAKYLIATVYFAQENYEAAEEEIMDFANKNTPHQYWLARSLVLLADIYVKKGDDFQAKQYLLSLRNNYKGQDDISILVDECLQLIDEREKERIIE